MLIRLNCPIQNIPMPQGLQVLPLDEEAKELADAMREWVRNNAKWAPEGQNMDKCINMDEVDFSKLKEKIQALAHEKCGFANGLYRSTCTH